MKHQNINVIENGIKITLNLGRQGEYNVRDIKFDMSDFQQKYGDGTATIVHYPANGSSYTVPSVSGDSKDSAVLDVDNILTWTIGRLATRYDGDGIAEITWLTVDGLKKSIRYNTYCRESIGDYGADRTAQQSYIDQMVELASTITDLSSEFSDAERIAAEIVDARENAVSDIETLKNDVVSAVNTAKSESIEDIGDSKESALDALNTAKQTALTDIESAKQDAETDINAEILIAETHANSASQSATLAGQFADNASNSANSANQSATLAGQFADNASNSANSANQSATLAGQSATSAQTSANNASVSEQNAHQSAEDAQDILDSVQAEGNTQISRVQAKGDEIIASLPDDFTQVQSDLDKVVVHNLAKNATWTNGRAINSSSGNELSYSSDAASSYINVSGRNSIYFMRRYTTSASSIGMVFYNASKDKISSIQDVRISESSNFRPPAFYKTTVPENAVYARFSYYRTDSEEFTDYPFVVYDADLYEAALETKVKQNTDDISTQQQKLINAFPTDIVSSDVASFIDGADDLPVKSLIVNIKSIQSGSGTPSPTKIRNISGWTGAKISRSGKNLFDINEYIAAGASKVSNAAYPDTYGGNKWGFYYLHGKCTVTTAAGGLVGRKKFGRLRVSFYKYDSNTDRVYFHYTNASAWDNHSGNISSAGMKTYTSDAGKICDGVALFTNQGENGTFKLGNLSVTIVDGSTDTEYPGSYVAVKNVDWSEEAGEIYGGTLNVTTGELIVDRFLYTLENITSIEEEYIKSDAIDACIDVDGMDTVTSQNAPENILCDRLLYAQSIWGETGYPNCWTINNGQLHVNLSLDVLGITDVTQETTESAKEKINAWLDTNKPVFVLPLAQPIAYSLIPQDVNTLLEKNNIWSDTGETNVEYRADIKRYIDKVVATAISTLS